MVGKMAVVIYSDIDGVYLGTCMGLGFWSKLDPVGQPSAATFENEAQAEAFMATWDGGRPEGVRFVPVEADDGGTHASMASCMRSGLPGWLDEETPVVNAVPV